MSQLNLTRSNFHSISYYSTNPVIQFLPLEQIKHSIIFSVHYNPFSFPKKSKPNQTDKLTIGVHIPQILVKMYERVAGTRVFQPNYISFNGLLPSEGGKLPKKCIHHFPLSSTTAATTILLPILFKL